MNPLLLCVVFFANPPVVEIEVDWNKNLGQTTGLSFGMNLFRGHDPKEVSSAIYRKALSVMYPRFVRLHSWEVMGDSRTTSQGWIDTKRRKWDTEKVVAALDGLAWLKADVMVNVPSWPDWMDADKDGLADDPEAFAEWCADLARACKRSKTRVAYLEITNEKDVQHYVDLRQDGGWGPPKNPAVPDRIAELAKLYVAAARAVHRVSPALKVGGPAAARPDLIPFAERFRKLTEGELDFYSCHAYASGDAKDPDAKILARAVQIPKEVAKLRSTVRPLPVFLDEYNISWTWETRDPRMTNSLGAVFDAQLMMECARQGIESTAAWNECDGIYGKSTAQGELRPSAHLFGSLNRKGIGRIAKAHASSPDIGVFAIQNPQGRTIWLTNTSNQAVRISGLGVSLGALISEAGFQERVPVSELPPYSVAWVSVPLPKR